MGDLIFYGVLFNSIHWKNVSKSLPFSINATVAGMVLRWGKKPALGIGHRRGLRWSGTNELM